MVDMIIAVVRAEAKWEVHNWNLDKLGQAWREWLLCGVSWCGVWPGISNRLNFRCCPFLTTGIDEGRDRDQAMHGRNEG